MIGTLGELAVRCAGRVIGDPATPIASIGALDHADAGTLTFATDARYLAEALRSRAAAVLTDAGAMGGGAQFVKPLLVVSSTRLGLAELLTSLEAPRPAAPFVHPTASVDSSARIGERVHIGPHAVVGAQAQIGDDCVLSAGAQVGAQAQLGAASTLHPGALLLERCIAGARVTLNAGAVVGSDGFGYVFVGGVFRKIPQIGNVVLGDDVEVGSNTCIDRAQTGSTVVGTGTKLDNLVQIGHNCQIGKHCAFAAMVGLAGSTIIGDYVQVGGKSGFRGHMRVGDRTKIAGNTDVWGDVPADSFMSGRPAQDHRAELRRQALIRGLPKLVERVDALEGKPPKPTAKGSTQRAPRAAEEHQ